MHSMTEIAWARVFYHGVTVIYCVHVHVILAASGIAERGRIVWLVPAYGHVPASEHIDFRALVSCTG